MLDHSPEDSHVFSWSLAFQSGLCKNLFTSWDTTSSNFPENEPEAVHIRHDVRLKMTSVQSFVQNLWRHVALCTHSGVGRDVYLVGVTAGRNSQVKFWKGRFKSYRYYWISNQKNKNLAQHALINNTSDLSLALSPDKLHCQSQVCYTARAVSFHQDVLTLQIPVGDSRFPLGPKDLSVEVTKAWHWGVGQTQHGFVVQSGWFEVVIQRAVFMIVCDQVELSPGASSFDISRYETCERKYRRRSG